MLYEGHNHHNLLESTWYEFALGMPWCIYSAVAVHKFSSTALHSALGSAGLQSLQGIAGRQVDRFRCFRMLKRLQDSQQKPSFPSDLSDTTVAATYLSQIYASKNCIDTIWTKACID